MDQTITKGGAVSREFSIGQREREREREREQAITLVVQSGYMASSEQNLGPYLTGLVWRRHTDQLSDSRTPVTTSSIPVIQTSEHPIQLESHGAMESVAEATEYTAADNMDTGVPPPGPAADLATRIPPNLSEPVLEQNVWNTCLFRLFRNGINRSIKRIFRIILYIPIPEKA